MGFHRSLMRHSTKSKTWCATSEAHLQPEFLNRLDEVIIFNALTEVD